MKIDLKELERIGGVARNPDIAHAIRVLEISGLLIRPGQRATDQEIEDDLRDQLANGGC